MKTSRGKKKKVRRKNSCNCLRMRISNPRTSRFSEALYRTAIKFDNFNDFAEYYWNGLSIGTYWIGTDVSSFNPNSTLEKQYARQGRLIAYTSPLYLDTKYAAEVDTSELDPFSDITENRKENTNSIKILRPDLLYSPYTYLVRKAIEVWKYNVRYLPSSQYDLKEFWKAAQERHKKEEETGKKRKFRRRIRLKGEKRKEEDLENEEG